MPAASTFAFCGSPQPRQGFARCARRWRGLDSASVLPTEGIYRSGGGSRRKENPMNERSLTPNITVTIGHHSRIHFAFVTTAPMELASQRAKYRGHQHPLLAADPRLVGLKTLQHWLWQRLQAPPSSQVAA